MSEGTCAVPVVWQTSRFLIRLDQPKVMGIVNVTPDSFSDGSGVVDQATVFQRCDRLLKDGADILDLGAESTRPGAVPVSEAEECRRLLPVLRYAVGLGVPVSVDTYKPAVMQMALDAGADIINDVWALRWPGDPIGRRGVHVVAGHSQCGVCLMHMHGDPETMQVAPMSGDIVPDVKAFLGQAAADLTQAGVASTRICIDPGVGFGKTIAQNFSLLARQKAFSALGYPVLAGWSRKSSLGAVVRHGAATAPHERVAASVAAAVLAVDQGAHIVRVHDVRETVDALAVWSAMQMQMQMQMAMPTQTHHSSNI